MTDEPLRRIEGRIEHDGTTKTPEIPMSVFVAERKARPLSPLQQTEQTIKDCQAKLKEYDRYYQGSEIPSMQGLRKEYGQIIRYARYCKTVIGLGKPYPRVFSESYRECAQDLQDFLERYPKKFAGFLKQQEMIAQRADDVTRSLFNPAVLHLSPERVREPASYLQAEKFIPAVDTSLRFRPTRVQDLSEERNRLWETYHCVRYYDGIFPPKKIEIPPYPAR